MQSENGFYTLNDGNKLPTLALGTWAAKEGEAKTAVKKAIELGYRSIDTATVYDNEEVIGEALKEEFEAGTVKREDMYITTKVWCNCHRADDLRKACEDSLKKLQLDYIDLYLVHWPWSGSADWKNKVLNLEFVPMRETWGAMEKLVEDGLVKSIGVSNFNVQLMLDMFSYAKIKPAVLQVELHPYLPQTDLVNWCAKFNILLEGYGPLGLGGVPGQHPETLARLVEREEIVNIAKKLGKSPAQVMLAWAINRGTRPLPKSANPDRLAENLASKDITLSQEDLAIIDAIPDRARLYNVFISLGLPAFA